MSKILQSVFVLCLATAVFLFSMGFFQLSVTKAKPLKSPISKLVVLPTPPNSWQQDYVLKPKNGGQMIMYSVEASLEEAKKQADDLFLKNLWQPQDAKGGSAFTVGYVKDTGSCLLSFDNTKTITTITVLNLP